MTISLQQFPSAPTRKNILQLRHWIVIWPRGEAQAVFRALPFGEVLQRRFDAAAGRTPGQVMQVELPDAPYPNVSFSEVDPGCETFARLTTARKLAAAALNGGHAEIGLYIAAGGDAAETWAEALMAALLAGAATMPTYKSTPKKKAALRVIHLYGGHWSHQFRRTYAEAAGNELARSLTHLPGNALTPADYRKRVAKLAKAQGWRMRFLDIKALARKKAGAFLAVAQGSPEPDAGIVHLTYTPKTTHAKATRLALVGKGICFDTGGVNLKPANFMRGMHKDMQGSAVALGTLLALSEIKAPFPVDCWLALATNHIGPKAYKPNDVVRAVDGTTIEIIHTDAEGRMVLADTLALASAEKPALIIDFATLTGACKNALGSGYSGIFCRPEHLAAELIEAGRMSGERVWPFPLSSDYDENIESKIADVKQCAEEGAADHIVAARFLQRFVKHDVPWLHIDLSSGTHKGGLAHVPTDITGFGVRLSLHLVLDRGLLKR